MNAAELRACVARARGEIETAIEYGPKCTDQRPVAGHLLTCMERIAGTFAADPMRWTPDSPCVPCRLRRCLEAALPDLAGANNWLMGMQ